jgi:hypothetical protein
MHFGKVAILHNFSRYGRLVAPDQFRDLLLGVTRQPQVEDSPVSRLFSVVRATVFGSSRFITNELLFLCDKVRNFWLGPSNTFCNGLMGVARQRLIHPRHGCFMGEKKTVPFIRSANLRDKSTATCAESDMKTQIQSTPSFRELSRIAEDLQRTVDAVIPREQFQRFQDAQRKVDEMMRDPQIAAGVKFILEQPKGGSPSNIRIPL